MKELTKKEAYLAMCIFLERYWERTGKGDELGALLGQLPFVRDEVTADPASWNDWLDSVAQILQGNNRAG